MINATVEIDDTAWGIPVFGVWIGFYRVETKETVVKEISVELFQGEAFDSKAYLKEATKLAKIALFRDLKLASNEPIRVCNGYILSSVNEWLKSRGFNCARAKIEGALQKKMESVSRDAVASLPNFSKGKSESLYDALIRYLLEDTATRKTIFKTGWNAIKRIVA